jgi:PilZ domain-containing protein/TonB-like protein
MATSRHQLGHHERRRTARIAPGLLTYASFDNSNGGMVLDVSETGLAIVAALAVPEASVVNLLVAADATHEQMEITGRVAWIAPSKRRLGIELIEVTGGTSVWKEWTSGLSMPSGAGTSKAALPGGAGLAPMMVPEPAPTVTPVITKEVSPPAHAETQGFTEGETRGLRAPLLVMSAANAAAVARPAVESGPKKLEVVPAKEAAAGKLGSDGELAQKSSVARTAANRSDLWTAGLAKTSEPAFAHVPTKSGDSRRSGLILGTIVLVAGSFGLGILIGRTFIWRAQRGNAVPVESGRQAATSPPERVEEKTSGSSDAQPAGGSASNATSTQGATQVVSASGPSEAAPVAVPARRTPADQNVTAPTAAESVWPGVEVLVTPREGEEPLRVELPAEVLMKTPSMEIVSQRMAQVPGVKASGRRKVSGEKLLFGPLLERVTPQPRPEALTGGAGGNAAVVTVHVTIEGDGHVSYVDPVSGPMTLMPSVMAAVREWQYGPSTLGREPVRTEADLTVTFHHNERSLR